MHIWQQEVKLRLEADRSLGTWLGASVYAGCHAHSTITQLCWALLSVLDAAPRISPCLHELCTCKQQLALLVLP